MEDFMQRVVLCAAIASAWVAEGAIAPSHIRLQPPARERGVAPASPVEGPKNVRWHGRHGRARMQTGRDGPVTRDATVLLWYGGWQTFFRRAATGVKPLNQIGFDLTAFSRDIGTCALLAGTWIAVALATGVLSDERYDRGRVVLTWAIAAPLAQLAKLALYGGTLGYFRPDDAITDIVCTLGLQIGLRFLEEENLV